MRSLYLIQQVDLNLLTVNLLKRLPYAGIPTLGEDRSQALLRKAKDSEGLGLDHPVTLRSCPASPIWQLPVR